MVKQALVLLLASLGSVPLSMGANNDLKAEYVPRDISKLEALSSNRFPITICFRTAERALSDGIQSVDVSRFIPAKERVKLRSKPVAFERFIADMKDYPIVIGKAVDEERTKLDRVATGFNLLKEAYPRKMVLLHFNGRSRRPEYRVGDKPFFPGHWIYQTPTSCLNDVAATGEDTVIQLADVSPYLGRKGQAIPDMDLCLYAVTDGKRDFAHSEYVKVVGADAKANTLTVRRGAHESTPRAFAGGQTEIARLLTIHGRFTYNYSTHCPKDAADRTCAEALVDDMAALFARDGRLYNFDGVLFDAMSLNAPNRKLGADVDLDMDGKADTGGFIDGKFDPWIGFEEYSRKLRERMGENFLILGDCRTPGHHRSFAWFNGTESEEWPAPDESPYMKRWASGIARHQFLAAHLRKPSLHEMNPRLESRREERLLQAAAACVGAGVSSQYRHARGTGEAVGFTDEMSNGIHRDFSGWLGQPVGEMIRLAERSPDLLAGKGFSNLAFVRSDEVTNSDEAQIEGLPTSVLEIKGIENPGDELYFKIRIKAGPMKNYASAIPRMCRLIVKPGGEKRTEMDNRLAVQLAENPVANLQEFFVDPDGEIYGLYFRWLGSSQVDLKFRIEGSEPAVLESIEAHAAPDVILREFEHGLVIGNPSLKPVAIDLALLFPGKSFRRIEGRFDPAFNDGSLVGDGLELGALDGIFLSLVKPE